MTMVSTDIADSTDWLPTSIPLLAPFESSLRCQVCKDLFNTPMITSCAHTFCSLCIRRCLENDGRCPTCREQDQPSKLRKNGTVQNIVDLFQEARTQTLEVARRHKELEEQQRIGASASGAEGGRKRKWVDVDGSDETHSSQKSTRQTRSQSKRAIEPATSQDAVVIDSDDGDDFQGRHESANDEPVDDSENAKDGLVPCPMCNTRMKEEAMWAHLDKCDGTPPRRRSFTKPLTPQPKLPRPPLPTHNIDRLPQPNFRLLKDAQLKKKMSDFGVPAWGDRQLLQRRYTEWVNLYNSNADSSRPRNTRELLRDLDTWERSQGGKASLREAKTKDKDFDGQAWAKENKDQFADLIAQARAKRKVAPQTDSPEDAKEQGSGVPESELQAAGAQVLPNIGSSDSVVVRSSPSTMTASADPLMAEASHDRPMNDDNEQRSSISGLENHLDVVDSLPTNTTPQSCPQSQDATQPSMIQHIPESPVQKRPMFTLPESGFADGDGIESGGQ